MNNNNSNGPSMADPFKKFFNNNNSGSTFHANSFTFPITQPAAQRPSPVFDFSTTNLSNFTNFPTTTHHNFDSGMARAPAAVPCQPAVVVLPVMMILQVPAAAAAGFVAAVPWGQLFPGSAASTTAASSHAQYPAPFVGGQSCTRCTCSATNATSTGPTSAFPQSLFTLPSSHTAAAAKHQQSTIFGLPSSSSTTASPPAFGGPSPFATPTMPPQPAPPFADSNNPGKYGYQGKFL